ncbi:MAG: DUF1302 domain-containing protein [Gammaproteobacteria bacterium]|uniref:Peptide ABC transporter substrate-binding protein n=1 Tax=Marinobacter nitratireducens TaxID=1137280 RepID=A0A072MXK6_9GAMM|nr:DUF1302 domain-containing protein [Marinobacter nitratireducens]KEF30006.1 hypothetical protein D777_03182 [Marinobacter nitratireducens]TNE74170.1 MAG: DUF1302 domain-containing protein [Gammaproteobacteria bacterium]
MKIKNSRSYNVLRLALAVQAACLVTPASAFDFEIYEIDASFSTTLTAGIAYRLEDQDKDLISQGNLGPEFAFSDTGASSNNFDDGNLNFEQGEPYSQILRGRSELFLDYAPDSDTLTRVGALVRGTYYYDYELRDNSRAVDPVGQQRELNPEAKDNAAGADLLDAYVFTDWYFGDTPVAIRYGRQVINWGESTFILGGINAVNPIDVPAFRAPGAELKDVLLPVEALYTSVGITPDITVEAFVQTDWEPFRIDDCGTFFSSADVAADGCGPVLLAGQVPDSQALEEGFIAPRLGDREPGEQDQFGVAARWFVTDLDAELGVYYTRYNSRLPYISGVVNNPESPTENQMNNPDLPFSRFPSYFIEYPKGIDLFGLSINTTLPTGTSLGAEYSFRPNLPIQWNTFELIYGGLQQRGPDGQTVSKLEQREQARNYNYAGQAVDGYDRFKVSQAQATLIHFIDRVMGAARFIIIGEVGATYIHDLPGKSEARYGRSGIYGVGPVPLDGASFSGDFCSNGTDSTPRLNINATNCQGDGFTTSFSWGYRTLFVWDYPDAVAGVNLRPRLFLSHDVKGYAPDPGGNFKEGNKAVGLGLEATYQNAYKASLSYTNYFGGDYNEINDRDFAAASISYSF